MIPEIIERYVETGLVRYVYREFPLPSLHPNAPKASEAAVCAGQQDRYWEMNEKLFETAAEWGAQGVDPAPFLKGYAEELGLDTAAFDECLDSGAAASAVRSDQLAGETFGVNATPYFFVNDIPIRGGLPIEALGRIIEYVAAGGEDMAILPQGEDWHVRGDRQSATAATVAFVNYADPGSRQHALDVLPGLVENYIDTGQLVYVLHPWTVSTEGPGAQAAAAAECAGQQGQFWEMHAQVFEEQDVWTEAAEPRPLFVDYAGDLGLDAAEFETCLDSDWAALRVQAGGAVAALYGIADAPVFLFNDGQGPRQLSTYQEFEAIIDPILNR